MKLRSIFLGIYIILQMCLSNSCTEKNQFHTFIKQLTKLDTPVTFNSHTDYELNLQYPKDNQFFISIQNEYPGFGVCGIFFETKEFVAILGNIPNDNGTPVILTFDKNGKKIDAHVLYENVMEEPGKYVSNSETILPNMQLVFIDSTITRKITADGSEEISGTDSLSVKTKKYIIDNTGNFRQTE
jgi:hypothetical protein